MTDLKQKIMAAVVIDLEDIEKALADNLNPYFDLVSQVAGHILFAGGKRLRPLLSEDFTYLLRAQQCRVALNKSGQPCMVDNVTLSEMRSGI